MAEDEQRPEEAEADERLLTALRAVALRVDPVPDEVEDAARGAFAWRTIDADLAELAYDSLLDDDHLAGVRSGDAPRTLTFEGPAFSVEIEVAEEGARRRLLGQLVPPAPARIEVRHSGGLLQLGADEVGRFSAEGVAAGPMSLRCRVEGTEGPPLDTAWVTV
jgi:hypothetical protein